MKNLICFLVILLLVIFTIVLMGSDLLVRLKAQEVPPIIITEIMYNPAGADSGHEWLEIGNVSSSTAFTIDENWRFNEGSNHVLTVVQGENILATNALAVIADNAELFLQDYPDYQGLLIDSSFSLNNTTDTLMLSVDNGQTFFATTTYQLIWGGNNDGYTLSRVGLTDEWLASTQPGGTPGAVNFPAQVQEEVIATSTEENFDDGELSTSTLEIIDGNNATVTIDDLEDMSTTTVEDLSNNQGEENQDNNNQEQNLNEENNNPVYSSEIIINEILPNPNGSDSDEEFIEFFNRSNAPVDLFGWQVKDNSTRRFTINSQKYQSTVIAAYGYFVVYSQESGIALNNNGDAVNLYQPDGNLLDTMAYFDQAESGRAYAKNGGEFVWTLTPTPGQANIIKIQETSGNSESTVVYVNQPVQPISAADEVNIQSQSIDYDLIKYQGLRINEFLPDPTGSDAAEWIEIFNSSANALSLEGFKVDDGEGGSKPYVFGATTTIAARQYLLINKSVSKLSLNNDEDEVRLLGPDNVVIYSVPYVKAKTGQSYNYDELNEEWFWSNNLTPGQKNFQNIVEDLPVQLVNEPLDFATEPTINIYDFDTVKLLPKNESIKIIGAITAVPGQLYKKSFYLSAVDPVSGQLLPGQGLEIYAGAPVPADFKIGDVIEIEGKVSYVKDRARLNLSKDKKITVLGYLDLLEPLAVSVDELQDELLGALVSVSGQVVKKQSNSIYLDNEGLEIRVDFKEGVKDAYKNLKEGDMITVAGILIAGTDGYRLLPRIAEDVQTAKVLGVSEIAAASLSSQTIDVLSDNRGQQALKYLFYSGGGLVTILASLLIKLKFFS
ncbi:MAG: lamin tail domain-containing protein [Candidatus Komeilibacteria bacterium]|nr:lamin tail domain-containing protein [Candidatus Komeilibacteria bacterium]